MSKPIGTTLTHTVLPPDDIFAETHDWAWAQQQLAAGRTVARMRTSGLAFSVRHLTPAFDDNSPLMVSDITSKNWKVVV